MVELRVLPLASFLLLLAQGLPGVEVQVTFQGEVTWADISGLSRGQPVSGKIIYDNTEPATFQDPSFRLYESAVTHYEVRIGTTEYVAVGGRGTVALGDDVGADFITFASGPGARLLGPILDGHEPNSLYLELRSGSTALLPSLDLSSMKTKYALRDLAAEPLMGIMFSRGGDLDFRAQFALYSLEAGPRIPAGPAVPLHAIRLEDIVAGGDGSGNAPPGNTGIDPRTGLFTTSYFEGFISDTDGVNPQPVSDSPYIDSVFLVKSNVPTATDGCPGCFVQPITQTGIQFQIDDQEDTNGGWNFILKDRVGGVTAPGIRVGGLDFFASSIGLHAAEGITFDLDALRARHGPEAVGCFSAFWGLDDCSIGLIRLQVTTSSDELGIIDSFGGFFGPQGGDSVFMDIPEVARYLTLFSSSVNGNINCDHGVFARPIITPRPCPTTHDSWIWRISPSRVAGGGEPVTIEGEGLLDGYSIRVGGVDMSNQVYLGDTLRSARTPPLPAGTYDAEVVDWFGVVRYILPGAIEVASPPVILSATPDKILTDRRVECRFEGQNLRPDMEILVVISVDGSAKLVDQEFHSPTLITGKIPPLDTHSAVSGSPVFLLDQGRLFQFPVSLLYVEIGLEKVEPDLVPAAGGSVVTFHGMGFEPDMTFRIGSSPLLDVEVIDAGHARGRTPPLAPGLYPISLVNSDSAVLQTVPGALLVQASSSPLILSFVPQTVSTRGGDLVAIVTTSWHGAATARLGETALTNLDTTEPTVLRGESPPLDPGFHALELVGADGTVLVRIENAIQAVPPVDVTLTGVFPFEVSVGGGTPVTFTGTGFEAGIVPRLGGLSLTQVEVMDSQHLRGLSPPLEEGLHDAALTEGNAERARVDDAVEALPLVTGPVPVIGRPQATHFAAVTDRIDIAASGIPAGAVLRVGGVPVTLVQPTSPCGVVGGLGAQGGGAGVDVDIGGHIVYEGLVPELPPGRYAVDFYLPGQGVVATLEDAVEVIAPTAPPLASHVVSADVLADGSTRLHIFGSCFGPSTTFVLGGKPIADASIVSPRLAVGHAPALGPGEPPGPRNLEVLDPRGNSTLIAAVVYAGEGVTFVRGDVNQSGAVDISDAVTILGYLFLGNPTTLGCFASADIDDGGNIDITDPIQLLGHLFLGGTPPQPPYPTCGEGSPTAAQTCESFEPCGGGAAKGGGAGIVGNLKANVFVLAEERTSPGEPILRDVSPVTGEVVIDDPPGGLDLQPGDIIAGYVPIASAAIHEGLTYLVKLDSEGPTSCLATQPADRTYFSTPATLADTFTDAAIDFKMPGSAVESRIPSDAVVATGNTRCDLAEAGQGGEADGAGGAFAPLIDVNFEGLSVFSWQDGPNYIHAGFHRLRVLYAASEASLGVGISATRLTGVSFFSGILLDAQIETYIDSHFEQHIQKEKKVLSLRKDHIVVVLGVPIHFAATGDLYAGVNLDAQVNLFADAGAKAHFKAGAGFRFDGSRIHNLSGIDPPTLEAVPGYPNLNLNGAIVVKGYVRPETHLFAGILFRGLTADLGMHSEAFLRFHAEGETQPVPCFQWGIDAGMRMTLIPEIQLFGYDLFDQSFDVINHEEIDLLGDEYGCEFLPVPRVSYRLVKLAEGKYEVHLDASGSYDPDGGPLRYRWDFNADGQCDRATRNDPRTVVVIEHACAGPFVVSLDGCSRNRQMILRVTDDEDSSVEKRFTVLMR